MKTTLIPKNYVPLHRFLNPYQHTGLFRKALPLATRGMQEQDTRMPKPLGRGSGTGNLYIGKAFL